MKKNMRENFEKLERRIEYTLENTDIEKINYELSKIHEPTLISGVGGSSVVSEFASKVLEKKNNVITRNVEPRDFKYMNINLYKNVLACSYSGNNYGVELAFMNDLNHLLLSSVPNESKDITNLTYSCDEKEKSFISLSSTLIPCSILLNYYLNNKEELLKNIREYKFNFDVECDAYEIFTGIDTSVSSKFLESTMIESGIAIPILHDKYSYCHGRSTISTVKNNIAIYFYTGTQLDSLLLEEIQNYYKDIIIINTSQTILGEYQTLIKCMYLTKYIAEQKNKDLSGVDYNPIAKKLYKFNGNL